MSRLDATAVFDEHRERLFGVAYRMTGSVADAQDICQDAWLRWERVDRAGVANSEAFLVRIVTRLALDRLSSARARRENYVGPFLPEPLVTDTACAPEANAVLADSMTFAFLVVLDELSPVERAVFLLHDVFGYTFAEIAGTVDRTAPTCRQIASRARRRMHEHQRTARPVADTDERVLLDRLIARIAAGDITGLMELLAPDVVELDDGGSLRRAARRPIVGPHRVARFVVNIAKRVTPGTTIDTVRVNGQLGLLIRADGEPNIVLSFHYESSGLVSRIFAQLNPEKLRHL